jgi:flagellin-like hook-associated protein FlgL
MRISDSNTFRHFITNYYRIKEELDRSNQEIGSGKKLLKPSDNPVDYSRSIVTRSNMNKIDQFNKNINYNLAYSKEVQSALSGIEKTLIDIKDETLSVLNGTMDDDERKAVSDYILANIEDLKNTANTKYLGKSIFAGFETSKTAYSSTSSTVVNIDSLPSMVTGTKAKEPFEDLPELDKGIYNMIVNSNGTDATISLTDEDGNVIQVDSNGLDDTSAADSSNTMADSLTIANAAGKKINIGRGIEIELGTTLTTGTQSFKIEYTEDSSMAYHGDAGEYKGRVMDDTIIPISIPGNKIFQGDKVIGSRFIDETNGITIPSGKGNVTFTIGDGSNISSVITLTEGTSYTQDQILTLLDNAGLYVGTGDNAANTINVKASFDENGHLVFGSTNEVNANKIIVSEYTTNQNTLENTLGIKTGTYSGQDLFDVLTDIAEMIANNTFHSKINPPSSWSGVSNSEISVGGTYTGNTDNTYLFTVDSTSGTVGVTPGMTINVTDKSSGQVVATLDVGDTYEPGTEIEVTDGVNITLSSNTLEANDTFTVSVQSERDRLDRLDSALEQVTSNSVKVGYNINRLEAVSNRIDNLDLTFSEELSNLEDADIAESYINYQSDEVSYNAMMQLFAKFQQLTLLNFI